eukprot:tig00021462_g21590.t1
MADLARGLYAAGEADAALRAARRMLLEAEGADWGVISGIMKEAAKCGQVFTQRGAAVDAFMGAVLERCAQEGWRLPGPIRSLWVSYLAGLGWLGRARAVLEEGIGEAGASKEELQHYHSALLNVLVRFNTRAALAEAVQLFARLRSGEVPHGVNAGGYGAIADGAETSALLLGLARPRPRPRAAPSPARPPQPPSACPSPDPDHAALIGARRFEEAAEVLRLARREGHWGLPFANMEIKLLLRSGREQDAWAALKQMESLPRSSDLYPDHNTYFQFFRHLSDGASQSQRRSREEAALEMHSLYWRALGCKVSPSAEAVGLIAEATGRAEMRGEEVAVWRERQEKAAQEERGAAARALQERRRAKDGRPRAHSEPRPPRDRGRGPGRGGAGGGGGGGGEEGKGLANEWLERRGPGDRGPKRLVMGPQGPAAGPSTPARSGY